VDPHALSVAAEDYIHDAELRRKHGEAARATVLSYDWATEVAELRRVISSF